jgi:hypothetical protein
MLIAKKTTLSTYGGLHTIYAANRMADEWQQKKCDLAKPDPRWKKFPARIYLFPKAADMYKDLLRQMGEEDNQNLRFVNLLFRISSCIVRKLHLLINI